MKIFTNILLLILVISLCLVSFSAYKLNIELDEAEFSAEQSRRAYEAEGFSAKQKQKNSKIL